MMGKTTLLFLLLAGALSVALFSVKYQVQDLEEELVGLNRSITSEKKSIHVLKAEWSHLNNPQRLDRLARKHLGMKPVEPDQMKTFDGVREIQLTTASGDAEASPAGDRNVAPAPPPQLATRKASQ
ncbi:MAG: cell division protein FtsL [Rhodospirillaceae bacterium]|jgi:cell division protein FtsL|nr:cell division protein FtsL [Rhodospirillaceae bacterium]MBT4219690.1 cell division protein FtsL [Rhodospirillaceae bacterium]MBT5309337.1 cell division protein FtsL [Rhodospirillaceae bacterium]MBT7355890.1 cell division protein FtsL [Rhodospirillaceae bacterium]